MTNYKVKHINKPHYVPKPQEVPLGTIVLVSTTGKGYFKQYDPSTGIQTLIEFPQSGSTGTGGGGGGGADNINFSNPNIQLLSGTIVLDTESLVSLVPNTSSYALTSSWAYNVVNDKTGSIIKGTKDYIPFFNSTSSLSQSILYYTSSKIGLGTTNPFDELHIKSLNSTQIMLESDADNNITGIRVKNEDTDDERRIKNAIFWDNSSSTDIWGRSDTLIAVNTTASDTNVKPNDWKFKVSRSGDIFVKQDLYVNGKKYIEPSNIYNRSVGTSSFTTTETYSFIGDTYTLQVANISHSLNRIPDSFRFKGVNTEDYKDISEYVHEVTTTTCKLITSVKIKGNIKIK